MDVWNQEDDKFLDSPRRLRRYMGALLHQMAHAFLMVYMCEHSAAKEDVQNQGRLAKGMAGLLWRRHLRRLAKIRRILTSR